jgi:AAA family ATP:ADP antiporter
VNKELSPTERFLSLFTTLRAGEGFPALLLAAQAFAIMFSLYLLKVIRDTLILSQGDAELKAYATAIQAGLLIFIVPIFARLYFYLSPRSGKHLILCCVLQFFLFSLLLFAVLYWQGVSIAVVFYIWQGLFAVMSLAVFWAFAADLFNPRSGQRLFPLIAAAGALGALLGAASAAPLNTLSGHVGVLCAAALLLLVPLTLSGRMEEAIPTGSLAGSHEAPVSPGSLAEGFSIVLRSRYLSAIAALVVLLNLINTNGEFVVASLLTDELARQGLDSTQSPERAQRITGFYATYQSITALLGLLIQLFLVSRVFDRFGIRGALLVLPIVTLLGYGLLSLLPLLMLALIVLIAENSISYSLTATTRHALFLPVSREQKYIGKQTIETLFFRLGDMISGGLVYVASSLLGFSTLVFMLGNLVLSVILLGFAIAIGRYHYRIILKKMNNLPPVLASPISDLRIDSGRLTEFVFNTETFGDPDEGDALRYTAYLNDSEPLPPWIEFDGLQRKFSFNPGSNDGGRIQLRVVARDFQGLSTESRFDVHVAPVNGRITD